MTRCYRCRLRMVYAGEDGRTCLACGRDQQCDIWMPPPLTESADRVLDLAPCEQCAGLFPVRKPSDRQRFCSKSCRMRWQNQQRRLQKPWRELVLR